MRDMELILQIKHRLWTQTVPKGRVRQSDYSGSVYNSFTLLPHTHANKFVIKYTCQYIYGGT